MVPFSLVLGMQKRERDREERAEYFKKLDGYKLRKEKVYVV
jgi:hypothetical protein